MTATGIPGMQRLRGAVDSHVHCCPHINDRTYNVFDAVRQAAAGGMKGLGLMDVFANSSVDCIRHVFFFIPLISPKSNSFRLMASGNRQGNFWLMLQRVYRLRGLKPCLSAPT